MTEYIAFSTIKVPPRFLVRDLRPADKFHAPLFVAPIAPETLIIDLFSGGSFGSGAHPTTQMCLTALADFITRESSVLDLGCGSGALAIGAAKLGARKVVAIDIDQTAVIRTRDNAALNGVGAKIDVRLGSTVVAQPDGPFDIIAANLLTPTILVLARDFPGILAVGGRIILSGVLKTQSDRVRAELESVGLRVLEARDQSGWNCLIVGAI